MIQHEQIMMNNEHPMIRTYSDSYHYISRDGRRMIQDWQDDDPDAVLTGYTELPEIIPEEKRTW